MLGCKSVSSIGRDDQLILVTFRYWGDDFKISCLGKFLRNLVERFFLDLGMPYGT